MIRKAHRALGLLTGPLVIVWFVSGIVMMYVPHPKAHRSAMDRLVQMAPLAAHTIVLDFQQAWLKTGMSGTPVKARLNMLIDRPAYFFLRAEGGWKVVYADNGEVLKHVTPDMAIESASSYTGRNIGKKAKIDLLDRWDQWTVGTGSGPGYRPFYRIKCSDDAGTWVHVSRSSGEVCQVTTKRERFLVWLGSIPHWLYFTVLRQHLELWRQVIIWIAGVGTVAVALGLWIGIAHFRWKGYGRHRYRRSSAFIGVKKWHHFLGMGFGLTTLLWIFSGMLSLSPLHWHSESSPSAVEMQVVAGGDLTPSLFTVKPSRILSLYRKGHNIRKVDLMRFNSDPYYLLWKSRSDSFLIRADEPGHPFFPYIPTEEIVAAARGLLPENLVASYSVLHDYDLYYVDKKERSKLPVVKIDFDAPNHPSYYINMSNGVIEKKYDRTARVNRWLYRFLHCFDLPILLRHRLLRDMLMLFFLSGGLLQAAFGLYSWIRRNRWKKNRKVSYF
jgi:hypothetical protein